MGDGPREVAIVSRVMFRVICPVCSRTVAAYVPSGGDGTALRPYKHSRTQQIKGVSMHSCLPIRRRETCPGHYDLVDVAEAVA